MDTDCAADPALSSVADLFAMPVDTVALTERPLPRHPARRPDWLGRMLRKPEFFGIAAIVVLTVCAVVGGVLNNGFVALGGLAAPILLGIAAYLATRQHRAPAASGSSPSHQ